MQSYLVILTHSARTAACATLLAMAVGSAAAQAPDFHTPPNCWTEPRIYHAGPIPSDLRANVSIGKAPRETLATPADENAPQPQAGLSPNRAYRFHLRQLPPDPQADLPWRAEVLIDNERADLTRILVTGVRDASTEWVTEKLLFIRVWWGRIAASDFIFDVEAERFVYEEMAWYGGIAFQQFQESCDDACPCRFPPHQ